MRRLRGTVRRQPGPSGTFTADGTETGAEVTSVEDEAAEMADESVTDDVSEADMVDDTMDVGEADDAPFETTNTQPSKPSVAETPVDTPIVVATVDPAETLALSGVGTVSEAGYRCDADQSCGFQHPVTGLVFALPSGWGSDTPMPAPAAEGR